MRKRRRGTTYIQARRRTGPAPTSRRSTFCSCGALLVGGVCNRCRARWLAGIVMLFLLVGLYVRVTA